MSSNHHSLLELHLKETMNTFQTIPDEYRTLDEVEVKRRISAAKQKLGRDLTILGHYYQRDEVIEWADHEGDSFELSRFGASTPAKHIVFCGVKFMAEAASILSRPGQRVYLPNQEAGCPLSDMADIEQVEAAWKALSAAGVADSLLPVAYMNSSAEIKAFCGRNGGTICTSSSAAKAFAWAKSQGKRVFFFPDENLGLNTAMASGIERSRIVTWDPKAADHDAEAACAAKAEAIVWRGHCHVHTLFTPEHVAGARALHEGCKVVVHPECTPEVVAHADANGSTSFIKKYAEQAPAGSTIIIGTEINFVNRIARQNLDKRIKPLARSLCPNMFRTSLADLLWTLERIGEVNEVRVPERVALEARVALDRMLKL